MTRVSIAIEVSELFYLPLSFTEIAKHTLTNMTTYIYRMNAICRIRVVDTRKYDTIAVLQNRIKRRYSDYQRKILLICSGMSLLFDDVELQFV